MPAGTFILSLPFKVGTSIEPPRADVAKFILDAVTDSQWDGSPGILLGGAKS